jgi:hypothetical protein
MHKRDAPSKKIQLTALVLIIAATTTIFGCRETTAPTAPASAPAQQVRSKEQAMNALMALPELKAWSQQIEKSSGGTVQGALIEYDPTLRVIDGKRYFQFSFVENASDATRRWESFLVAETGDQILVDDAAMDKTLTLEQWRSAKHPLERKSAN